MKIRSFLFTELFSTKNPEAIRDFYFYRQWNGSSKLLTIPPSYDKRSARHHLPRFFPIIFPHRQLALQSVF